MGLDMYLEKAPKIEGATISDLGAADSYMRLLEYRKAHPGEEVTVKSWMGRNLPDKSIIDARKAYGKPFFEEVAYWRKANAIHKWFSDKLANGDFPNCGMLPVTQGQLEELLNTCLDVIGHSPMEKGKVENGQMLKDGKWQPIYQDGEVMTDTTYAKQNLPTQSGFFFGSTAYDSFYMEDIKDTVTQINDVLNSTDFSKEQIFYSANW